MDAKLPLSPDLIIKLLAEELRSNKLFDTLQTIGFSECWYRPDLSDVILTLLYGPGPHEKHVNHYCKVINHHTAQLKPGNASAYRHARLAYRELKAKSQPTHQHN
jgi:hypothetical protein